LFWGIDNVGAAAGSRFIPPGRNNGLAITTDLFQLPCSRGGTIRNLFVRHNSPGGGLAPVTYVILVNGIATAITVVLATGVVGQASDLVNTVVVVAGDRVSLRADKPVGGIGGGNVDVQAELELA
jgi:hypothetical protein